MMEKFNIDIDETKTLWQRWVYNSETIPEQEAIVHWVVGEEPFRWNCKQLVDTAKKYSAFIKAAGIERDQVCSIIIRHNPLFYPIYMGISRTGALPAVLAYPNPRLHPDKFRQGIEGMSQRSGLHYILTERELEPLIRPLVEKPGSTIKEILFPLEWNIEEEIDPKVDEEIEAIANSVLCTEPALLQHSSGTTGLQKPVMLSHIAISKHIKALGQAVKYTRRDKVVNWLPLYHDLGLIATFQIPLALGVTSVFIDPFQWIIAPIILLEAITKEKGTFSCLPNFAYNIMADKIPDDELEGIDLSSVRALINASEPIRHDSHKKFADRFSKYGFNPLALACMYGMAEVTLGLVTTDLGKPISEVVVDRNELANGRLKFADENSIKRICVSSGRLIDGCKAKVIDENKNELPVGSVGEFVVSSQSMFDGYRNYPEKTAEVLQNDWYLSGDYGFIYNDEFYVIGRKKDIIIVAGKNIYPEDIEDAVNQADGVIPGRVIAFGQEDEEMGTEQVAVIAETKAETETDKNNTRMSILRAGMTIDINITKVYLVPPRWLIKSSAGKPSRKANKERLAEGTGPEVWSR
jgi:fatty-acyl-CoA synthase